MSDGTDPSTGQPFFAQRIVFGLSVWIRGDETVVRQFIFDTDSFGDKRSGMERNESIWTFTSKSLVGKIALPLGVVFLLFSSESHTAAVRPWVPFS